MARIELLQKFPELAQTANIQQMSARTNVVKGHINKLMFVFPKGVEYSGAINLSQLSIKKVGNRVETIMTKLIFEALKDISNEKFGAVTGQPADLVGLISSYESDGGTDVKLISAMALKIAGEKIAVLVDLGSFQLDGGTELIIDYTRYGKANEAVPEVQIFSISDEENEGYHILKYDVDYDLNEMHSNVKELYLIDSKNWENTEFDIWVDSKTVQYQMNNFGALGYAMLTGRFENTNPEVYKIYESLIPEDVAVKITGRGAGEVGVLAIRVDTDINIYEIQQRASLKREAEKVENLEKFQPEIAEVLHASGMPSSAELAIKANEFKK